MFYALCFSVSSRFFILNISYFYNQKNVITGEKNYNLENSFNIAILIDLTSEIWNHPLGTKRVSEFSACLLRWKPKGCVFRQWMIQKFPSLAVSRFKLIPMLSGGLLSRSLGKTSSRFGQLTKYQGMPCIFPKYLFWWVRANIHRHVQLRIHINT